MGIFCQSCDSQKGEKMPTQKNISTAPLNEIVLPKLYVSDKSQKEETKTDKNSEKGNQKKELSKTHNIKLSKSVIAINKLFLKSKTIIIIKDELKKKKNLRITQLSLDSNKLMSSYKKKIPRINSLEISKEKTLKIISNEINFLTELRKKLNFKKGKNLNHESAKNIVKISNKNLNPAPFKRRKKKSTTLMENTQVFNQLMHVQMSIPLFQELLIPHLKGNPTDKYIIGKKMGSGSYGTVFEATNIIFKTKVAMKKIVKDESMNEELIRNEIDILRKLSHPNIVRIYEFYETKNCFYLVNEVCEQGELFNYINNSILNEQQLAIIFYQVFSGLCYLHENNILHRDIKPENILISSKEKDLSSNEEYFWIKIIDFGTAKIFLKGETEKKIIGSAYYIAPEVLDKNYNEKCDTWSVGVILYMFLVGRAPFDGRNNDEILYSIKTKEYDYKNERLNQHSKEVQDLVRNLLNKNTEKRFSAKEALNHEWFKKFNGRKLFSNFKNEDMKLYINNLFNFSFQSKIKQLVVAFLVHNMPSIDKFGNILKLYRYFNKSGDCKLSKNELIEGLSEYRNKLEVVKKVDSLFSILDGDNNGFIEYEEFLRACVDKNEILTESNLKYAFKFLDQKCNGKIGAKEIVFSFINKENQLFEIAISKDINEVDEDGDGEINFKEFKKLMREDVDNANE